MTTTIIVLLVLALAVVGMLAIASEVRARRAARTVDFLLDVLKVDAEEDRAARLDANANGDRWWD